MLTVRDGEEDKAKAFEAGADDYVRCAPRRRSGRFGLLPPLLPRILTKPRTVVRRSSLSIAGNDAGFFNRATGAHIEHPSSRER